MAKKEKKEQRLHKEQHDVKKKKNLSFQSLVTSLTYNLLPDAIEPGEAFPATSRLKTSATTSTTFYYTLY